MIPFAPNSGGQREILKGRTDRVFDSIGGAVNRIEMAIERDDRPTLPQDRFTRETFKSDIRGYVNRMLDR